MLEEQGVLTGKHHRKIKMTRAIRVDSVSVKET